MAEAIDYPALVRQALTGMIRQLLAGVAEEGLPGEHHFYIGFATDAAGVEMPPLLRQRHPHEMTIVLQHQFWNLEVGESGFSVTLRFSGSPARLGVPWEAITSFADPSVPFGLRLVAAAEGSDEAQPAGEGAAEPKPPADAAPEPAPARQAEPSPPANVVAFRPRRPE